MNGYRDTNGGTSLTVSAESGLSRLQRRILGLAFDVRMAIGADVMAFGHSRPADFNNAIGTAVLFGVVPDIEYSAKFRFTNTAAVRSAKVAISRSVTRLLERDLLIYRRSGPYGYILTPDGVGIGERHRLGIDARALLAYFEVHTQFLNQWRAAGQREHLRQFAEDRRQEAVEALRYVRHNGYRRAGADPSLTDSMESRSMI